MDIIIEGILEDTEISWKQKNMLLLMRKDQLKGIPITKAKLAERMYCSISSVQKHLQSLREGEYICGTREGQTKWKYDLSFFSSKCERPETQFWGTCEHPETQSETDPQLKLGDESPQSVNVLRPNFGAQPLLRLIKGGKFKEIKNRISPSGDLGGKDQVSSPLGEEEIPAKNFMYYFNQANSKENAVPPIGEIEMSKVIGPTSNLKFQVEEVLAKGSLKKGEGYSVKTDGRHERFQEKSPEDYNVNDIEIVFKNAWEESSLLGRPCGLTMKDRGQLKNLLKDQGGEAIAKLISYAIKQWDSLVLRYNVKGAPSISVIYSFRRSWIQEALAGGPPKVNKPMMIEYTETDFDGGETGWG